MLYDASIREPLYLYMEQVFGKIRFLEEKTMGQSRADAIMVMPHALCGMEIKSDADTYTRLSRQVRDYDQYFDYNLLVIGESHMKHASEHIPASWGLLMVREEADHTPSFHWLRLPKANPCLKMEKKLSLLWRPELNRLLALNHLPAYARRSKKSVASSILQKVSAPLLHTQISAVLYERDYTTIAQEIQAFRASRGKRPRRRRRTARLFRV